MPSPVSALYVTYRSCCVLADLLQPDFKACVGICTRASLLGMIGPGMLVIFSPIIAGLVFGEKAVAGLLAGTLVSSVQVG